MTITETLFGGLLAVVALFFIVRRLGLSYYWSAVLSGALPFLAYLGYSSSHWEGGDVLAIHLVVYMATAGILGVFGSIQRKKEAMHWGPKALIAFFAFLVVFNATVLSIAMQGLPNSVAHWVMPSVAGDRVIHTGFSGALPHDQNHLYEPHMQSVEQQRNLGWTVELNGLLDKGPGRSTDVSVLIRDKEGKPLDGAKVTLDLWRLANSTDDRRMTLSPRGGGVYGAEFGVPDAGRWVAKVSVERGSDTYVAQEPVTVEAR